MRNSSGTEAGELDGVFSSEEGLESVSAGISTVEEIPSDEEVIWESGRVSFLSEELWSGKTSEGSKDDKEEVESFWEAKLWDAEISANSQISERAKAFGVSENSQDNESSELFQDSKERFSFWLVTRFSEREVWEIGEEESVFPWCCTKNCS